MKKALFLLLALCAAVGLCGCVSYGVGYACMGETESIAEIAVFDLRVGWVDALDESMKPLGCVDSSRIASFVEELEAFPFVDQILLILAPSDPSFVYGGYVVKITYTDGSYELIGSTGYQSQHAGGKRVGSSHYGCDDDKWAAFVLRYLEGQP